ncbi:hypothetical protein A2866_03460 [Candidatus Roizmanbacteria bacterium RIFCSPHIGHO2_01_FULL_39_8]|uniref:Glycosyltransferase 2-like domain-containing protein n=2 Tax=Candidatus Roizmaniibacteriota TaxID=1752723 RepID=A0A1F7GT58_9BACT|nr:MAG: hypothetical protein A2866_03460 [Candidatus Roizmanbacteria bacterium RIFCSPHIGHO2_01_FULL_39_8]OGK28096.1 MAG: hypothetical protein A3C28_03215 [Candidatus Roizmanbacteria bacterium RIFCSPHIGHO2_02_FULL_39_9]
MKKTCQFSLIICCFNEEDNLEKTILESLKELKQLFDTFEIIIIEDKSSDRSPKIADRLSRKYSSIKVIHNLINLGQGISFLIGLHEVKGDLIMQNGADRPFNIKDLKKILPLFKQYDIVVVVRRDRSAYTFWRKLTSWVNNFLRKLLFGSHFSDLNFVQIYKRKVTKSIPILSRSAAFTTQELILRAKQKGYKIIEMELPYHKRIGGEAHHGKKRDILWALIDMVNFWLEYKR